MILGDLCSFLDNKIWKICLAIIEKIPNSLHNKVSGTSCRNYNIHLGETFHEHWRDRVDFLKNIGQNVVTQEGKDRIKLKSWPQEFCRSFSKLFQVCEVFVWNTVGIDKKICSLRCVSRSRSFLNVILHFFFIFPMNYYKFLWNYKTSN